MLKKPGVLTNEEFEIMKRHTVMGFEIVRQVKQLTEMLPGIRWHHEALNGQGYPDGIKGDELPLMVRIMSVADTFDAITTDRPYQAGKDFPQALEILRKLAGTKYDPIVVDAMDSAYEKGELAQGRSSPEKRHHRSRRAGAHARCRRPQPRAEEAGLACLPDVLLPCYDFIPAPLPVHDRILSDGSDTVRSRQQAGFLRPAQEGRGFHQGATGRTDRGNCRGQRDASTNPCSTTWKQR